MNQTDLRDLLYSETAKFFSGAAVIWAEQINTKPKLPYVTLKLRDIGRTVFPLGDENDDRAYASDTIFEVNLYTNGRQIQVGPNTTGNFVNTAAADMMEFANFLESEGETMVFALADVSIMLKERVRDLSELMNESAYRYRSMAEFDVTFIQDASGRYAISGNTVPNSSGGGTAELHDAVNGDFIETESENAEEEVVPVYTDEDEHKLHDENMDVMAVES